MVAAVTATAQVCIIFQLFDKDCRNWSIVCVDRRCSFLPVQAKPVRLKLYKKNEVCGHL